MMSSNPTPRFMDPVAHAKLPRLETTLGTKSGDMPRYSHEEPVNYSGSYFSYCLSGPEGSDLPPHWSPQGACLQRSPIVHPASGGRQLSSQITHRPDNMAHCVEGSPHAATRDLAANRQSPYYDRISEMQSPSAPGIHAPTAVRTLGVGGATVTPPKGSPVGLAVPKPIYGHNPCCSEHGCTSGPCYSMERGAPRVNPNAYNEEWMLHYGPLSLLQRKEHEALLQLEQSSVRFPLRETAPEGYHAMRPTRPMRFPSFIEPNYGNFPYASAARSPLSPSSDLFHRLQFPSKVYHSLPPPASCTYEDVQQMALTHPGIPPKMYPDRPPPAPRYTQLPQRPVFYYSQGNVELENPSLYKGTSRNLTAEPPPTVTKQVSPNPLGNCLGPQPSLRDFPAPCPAAPMNPSFPRSCDLSHFQMYGAHAGMKGQKRTFAEGPGAPLLVRHAERPVDYSSQRAWVTSSPRELGKRPLSPGAFHPVQHSLSDYRGSDHGSVGNGNALRNHSLGDEQSGPKVAAPQCSVANHEGGAVAGAGLARHYSSVEHSSSLCAEIANGKKHRDNASSPNKPAAVEALDLGLTDKREYAYETQASSRPQEVKGSDQRQGGRLHSPPSPPMPVINKVFSLAPYKAYLQASGMLPLHNGLQNKKACRNERDFQQGQDEPAHKTSQETVCFKLPSEANPVHMLEPHQIKTEKVTVEETDCSLKSDEIRCEGEQQGLKETMVKEEDTDKVTSSSDSVLDLRVKRGEFNVFTSEVQTSMDLLSSTAYGVDIADRHGVMRGLTLNLNGEHSLLMAPAPKSAIPTVVAQETKVFQQMPPRCLNRSAFTIIVPDVLSPPAPQSCAPEVPQPTPELKPPGDANRQARHRFLEMHQCLFRLISASVSQAPEHELRAWLADLEPQQAVSSPAKAVPVTGLLGAAAKEAWLRCRDTATVLSQVVGQLEDYAANRQCPFPHVIRAGALFIPMLVVKEYLFPQVLGALIDRVLQEHRVELRPTTLSEERHLLQLQRRACSSKLRRLLSLKHLPDIYPDVLNLYYHACVSKRLGIVLGTPVKSERMDCSEEMDSSRNGTSAQNPSSRPSPPDPPKQLKDPSRGSRLLKCKRKGRQRSASKRRFLGKEKPREGENLGYTAQSESWSIVNSFRREEAGEGPQSPCNENLEPLQIKVEEHSPIVTEGCNEEPESTWGPVTSDDLSSGNSDTETESAPLPPFLTEPSETTKSQAIPKSHSGMILKLRKVLFGKGPFRRDSKYQPFLDRGQPVQLSPQAGAEAAGEGQQDRTVARRMRARVAQRRRRVAGFPKVQRPTRSSAKVLPVRNSPMQLKFLPHPATGPSSQRRRRWVLRSAVQTAGRAMKTRYPDLVGKRICHLYEENDKSEVWYRGVVVRVHEPHLNPLKTVFEVKYDSEPEWQYYLELLMDYNKGWLKVED